MKAIIQGKRYDTDIAIEIGSASNNLSTRDFSHWSATLYRTPIANRFFLAGEGGPMSRWARPSGNMRTGGEGIIALDREEALAWAEQHLDAETVEAHFSDDIEDA